VNLDSKQRKEFWDALCSVKGINPEEESKIIKERIVYPEYLYRYRPVTVSTIDALQRNRLYYSNANYYDDPFDTLINIKFDQFNRNAIEFFSKHLNPEDIRAFGKGLKINEDDIYGAISLINKLEVDKLILKIDEYLRDNTQALLKENLWSVCFSERGDNEVLWLKYADRYKGFCVIYDMKNTEKLLCGKQSKCQNCVVNKYGVALYPIYYSDESYDATQYALNLALAYIAKKHLSEDIANVIIKGLPNGLWEQERIALIKSKCHEYDLEWRCLLRGQSSGKVMQEWIPNGVILGLKMDDNEREIVIRSAKMAGIEHIYELIISDNYKLCVREI